MTLLLITPPTGVCCAILLLRWMLCVKWVPAAKEGQQ
jgi:hypothetical protein